MKRKLSDDRHSSELFVYLHNIKTKRQNYPPLDLQEEEEKMAEENERAVTIKLRVYCITTWWLPLKSALKMNMLNDTLRQCSKWRDHEMKGRKKSRVANAKIIHSTAHPVVVVSVLSGSNVVSFMNYYTVFFCVRVCWSWVNIAPLCANFVTCNQREQWIG